MIEVEQLTKRYGPVLGIDRLTFSVGRGEIVGLLGPNGAGKTTTMRVLTTFLQPTSGKARLAGHDVLDEPLEVRRRVGYMPENPPLYNEMRVREFLSFRAKLRDVPRSKRKPAIGRVVERCRLESVEDRVLGQLSKGFRQRVGLAEAMVHDPDILILDEPTAGLDPIQVREVRALIQEVGDRHTILLSTHIMREVEAVCARVILIAQGKIVINDRLENVRSDETIIIEVRGQAEQAKKTIEATQGVGRVSRREGRDGDVHVFEVKGRDHVELREQLAKRLVGAGLALRRLEVSRSTLEDRFVQAVNAAAALNGPDPRPANAADVATKGEGEDSSK